MVVAIPPRNRSWEHVTRTKIPTQVQMAWVGGTTHPLSTPFVRRASLSLGAMRRLRSRHGIGPLVPDAAYM